MHHASAACRRHSFYTFQVLRGFFHPRRYGRTRLRVLRARYFYQNHHRYVKSKNVNQLQGDSVSSSDISDCSPIQFNSDLSKYRVISSSLRDDDLASPCGLIAASFFNGKLKHTHIS